MAEMPRCTAVGQLIGVLLPKQQAGRRVPVPLHGSHGTGGGHQSAQRAGIDHKRQAQPSAYLGRKPSCDRATFDRIRLALDSTSPPSLSSIAKAERLSKQTVFRLKQDPLAASDAWGL